MLVLFIQVYPAHSEHFGLFGEIYRSKIGFDFLIFNRDKNSKLITLFELLQVNLSNLISNVLKRTAKTANGISFGTAFSYTASFR